MADAAPPAVGSRIAEQPVDHAHHAPLRVVLARVLVGEVVHPACLPGMGAARVGDLQPVEVATFERFAQHVDPRVRMFAVLLHPLDDVLIRQRYLVTEVDHVLCKLREEQGIALAGAPAVLLPGDGVPLDAVMRPTRMGVMVEPVPFAAQEVDIQPQLDALRVPTDDKAQHVAPVRVLRRVPEENLEMARSQLLDRCPLIAERPVKGKIVDRQLRRSSAGRSRHKGQDKGNRQEDCFSPTHGRSPVRGKLGGPFCRFSVV